MREIRNTNRGLDSYLKRNSLTEKAKKLIPNEIDQKTFKENLVELKKLVKNYKYLDHIHRKNLPWYNFISHYKLAPMLRKTLIDRGHPLGWSKEYVIDELKIYGGNLNKLKKERYSVYERGLTLGIFQGKNKKGRKVYSQVNIDKIAKGCRSRQEFMTRHKSAYNSVIKFGLKLDLPDIPFKNYKGENLLRQFVEKVFNEEFIRIRPEFLRNPKTGKRLELDLYCQNMNLAFEHNGIQHYAKKNMFYKKQEHKHKFKKSKCSQKGVKLIMVPDVVWIFKMDEKKVKSYLKKELLKRKIKIPKSFYTTQFYL